MRTRAHTSGMTRHHFTVLMLAMAMLMLAATPAIGQTSAAQGYDESGVIGNIEESPPGTTGTDGESEGGTLGEEAGGGSTPSDREAGGTPATEAATGGELPFTGLDAALIALAGIALLGTGFALRRIQNAR